MFYLKTITGLVCTTLLAGAAYASTGFAPGFDAFLAKHPTTAATLKNNQSLSAYLLNNPEAQQQLMQGKVTIAELQQLVTSHGVSTRAAKAATEGLKLAGTDKIQSQAEASAEAALQAVIDGTTPRTAVPDNSRKPVVNDAKPATSTAVRVTDDLNSAAEAAGQPLQPRDVFNINAVPNGEVDAKGWPKHLQVPAHCPAPVAGKKYIHTLPLTHREEVGRHGSGTTHPTELFRLTEARTLGWAYLNHTKQEVYAVPFVSVNRPNGFGMGATYDELEWSISECPGVFRTAASYLSGAASPHINPHCYGETNWPEDTIDLGRHIAPEANDPMAAGALQQKLCKLEMGKVYYRNIRSIAASDAPRVNLDPSVWGNNFSEESRCEKNADSAIESRGGSPVCATMLASDRRSLPFVASNAGQPIYVGPRINFSAAELRSQYGKQQLPINYRDHGAELCGEGSPAGKQFRFRCTDPTDKEPELSFTFVCSGAKNEGNWLASNAVVTPAYLCENLDLAHPGEPNICSKHRDGMVRGVTCPAQNTQPGFSASSKCMFDAAVGRWRWKPLDDNSTKPVFPGCQFNTGQ